jgi:hypothetical protein
MKRIAAATAIVLGIAGSSVLAHHPFDAEYDWKRPVTITGTVTKFDWKNPHAAIEVKGKDQAGAEGQWSVELGSMAELQRAGWTSSQFRAGEQITVDGWLAKDGSKRVSGKSVKLPNGRELFAAGAFFEPGSRPSAAAPTTGTTQPKPAR